MNEFSFLYYVSVIMALLKIFVQKKNKELIVHFFSECLCNEFHPGFEYMPELWLVLCFSSSLHLLHNCYFFWNNTAFGSQLATLFICCMGHFDMES